MLLTPDILICKYDERIEESVRPRVKRNPCYGKQNIKNQYVIVDLSGEERVAFAMSALARIHYQPNRLSQRSPALISSIAIIGVRLNEQAPSA